MSFIYYCEKEDKRNGNRNVLNFGREICFPLQQASDTESYICSYEPGALAALKYYKATLNHSDSQS